jgi:hypothetical protein
MSSYQSALAYAKDRFQGRSAHRCGGENPNGGPTRSSCIRMCASMLLTQKAITEGCRALIHEGARLAEQLDLAWRDAGNPQACRR